MFCVLLLRFMCNALFHFSQHGCIAVNILSYLTTSTTITITTQLLLLLLLLLLLQPSPLLSDQLSVRTDCRAIAMIVCPSVCTLAITVTSQKCWTAEGVKWVNQGKKYWCSQLNHLWLFKFDTTALHPRWHSCLVSEMTYYVSSGTLNPTHSLTHWHSCAIDRASDLRFTGRRFESWLGIIA